MKDDFFGIGNAMTGMAKVYQQSARRTGRTTALVESLKDGDRVVFMDSREADRVRRMCIDRGVKVDCIVVPVDSPHRLAEKRMSEGRTIFDHSWVESWYLSSIEHARARISLMQQTASSQQETLDNQLREGNQIRWKIWP